MNVSRTKLVGIALAIFAVSVWLYWPSVHGEFLAGDDVEYLRQSERWNGLTWGAVKWAFTSTESYYHPLPELSHVLDYQIWGTNVVGHHATSVVAHALNAALVFGFLWALLGATSLTMGERLTMALWVAAVFTVHPLQTESVAWVAGRTQLLCTMFCIGSLWAYVAGARWAVVWGFYVAALLCKPMAVSLPFVMLAVDYYPLRRHERLGWRRLLWEKAGMMAVAGLVGVVTAITKARLSGIMSLSAKIPVSLRFSLMFESLTFYPLKLLWPTRLSPDYPISWDLSLDQWPVVVAMFVVVVTTAVAVMERRRRPMLGAAWGAYVALVLPISGLMLTGGQSVELRYAYVAMLPLLLLAGGGGVWLWRRSPAVARVVLAGLVAGQLGIFAGRARGLIADWRTTETRMRAEVAALPDSEEANRLFVMMLVGEGRAGEALPYARHDVEVAPKLSYSHVTLGLVLRRLGRVEEAVAQDELAFRLNPDLAEAQYNYGVALAEVGRVPEAIAHYEQALRIRPDYAEAHYNLGTALAQMGKIEDAIAHYEQALRIKPDYAEAHINLGTALGQTGKIEEAIAQFDQALRIQPDSAEAHLDLGVAWVELGRPKDAIRHYEQALRIRPNDPETLDHLGWLLATRERAEGGDPVRAVALAQQACQLTDDRVATYLDTLAAAYAAAARFSEAITTAEKARELAHAGGQSRMVDQIESRMKLYRDGQPYRQAADGAKPPPVN